TDPVLQHDIVRQTPPFAEAVEWSEALTYDHVTDPTLQPGASFLGRLSSDKVNNIATAYYGYDALGAPSAEIQVLATQHRVWSTHPTTSAGGLLQAIDYTGLFGQDRAEYHYDSAGRTQQVLFGRDATLSPVFAATTIDALGRYRDVLLGNGARETYTYRDQGRRELTASTVTAADGSMERRPLAYDALGRVIALDEKMTVPGRDPMTNHSEYTYDSLGHLASASTSGSVSTYDTYTTDSLGNLTSHLDLANPSASR